METTVRLKTATGDIREYDLKNFVDELQMRIREDSDMFNFYKSIVKKNNGNFPSGYLPDDISIGLFACNPSGLETNYKDRFSNFILNVCDSKHEDSVFDAAKKYFYYFLFIVGCAESFELKRFNNYRFKRIDANIQQWDKYGNDVPVLFEDSNGNSIKMVFGIPTPHEFSSMNSSNFLDCTIIIAVCKNDGPYNPVLEDVQIREINKQFLERNVFN